MKEVLYVDCCIRGEDSRTKKVAEIFLDHLDEEQFHIKHLNLMIEDLKPLVNEEFEERQALLEKNELNHPRFAYAHEFASADIIVIAAPFWDLSFPALLKIYIENVSVDGITFHSTSDGLQGLCKATNMIYFTTRGGFYFNSESEQATPYLKQLCKFFGIDHFNFISADGMDVEGYDAQKSLDEAIHNAKSLARCLE